MRRAIIIAALYYLSKRKKKQRRRLHVHPLIEQRAVAREFVTLYGTLRADETKFFNYFRMSTRTFDELLAKTDDKLVHSSLRRVPISPIERRMVTLRFLATGRTYTGLQYSFRIGITTISQIVDEVCKVIWGTLHDECIPTKPSDMWQEIANGFLQKTNFPNCIGAIDSKHIRIINPDGGGSMFYNCKKFYSIVLLAITLYRSLENNTLIIPGPKPLPGTNPPVEHVVVGGGAFGISKKIMKPYTRTNMTYKKKIFNYRLSRSRRYIELTFGIMSNKFRVFHTPINVGFNVTKNIVKACCVLHNFIKCRDGYRVENTLTIEGMVEIPTIPTNRFNNALREHFAEYFLSPIGSVSWQESCIF
ncbi:hypothetical protein K1T71_014433 [Dendrolimus kikuchii]|uniref:Uncharacterized protein n=1 Tax=Dendrolimus kikuchii TaxID=765133 RepID=A0ACC1CE95_9NEOP|nr:hypothetical protein K1T71_014433 [Dendrolimus kikuchii]